MARRFAQLAAVVFLVAGVAGFFTGDASHLDGGQAGGNFDGVALHLTYLRDIVNLVVGGAFAYAGWYPRPRGARILVLALGALLLVLAILGFALSDDDAGTRSFITLHFPIAMNILDLTAGVLAVLCALGDAAEPAEARA
ncbi:MAG: DUF4383 domain-containing protein [Candidatus Dormibacteraeota bacterium]|nr:DUF4383 domain-containing protein [Candidatus Dormibacteraeota bacterium]MBV9524513.1 DUF4383 domain-containing protein [Candidatus Dormibacteraeota bacterium]